MSGMKSSTTIFALVILLLSSYTLGEQSVLWPDLSTIKYVAQRSATESDINDGAAVFILQTEGVPIGTPLDINVPQYAIHTDENSGEKTNVVIIQAEEANGQQVFGALIFDTNEYMAGLSNEFELLGQTAPE